MRTIGGVVLGILLFFPGILLLQWLAVDVLGFYDAMTLTDGCLVMIIILLCVNLTRSAARQRVPSKARSRARYYDTEMQPALTSDSARRRSSRPRK